MVRMNIMMPEKLAQYLKTVPNKSRYIAEALEQRIALERSRKLRSLLAEAYSQDAGARRSDDVLWGKTLHDGDWNT